MSDHSPTGYEGQSTWPYATSGQVLGTKRGIGRVLFDELLNLPANFAIGVGLLPLLNYLWPLWDKRNQTWTDKVVKSVVVPQGALRR